MTKSQHSFWHQGKKKTGHGHPGPTSEPQFFYVTLDNHRKSSVLLQKVTPPTRLWRRDLTHSPEPAVPGDGGKSERMKNSWQATVLQKHNQISARQGEGSA